MVAHQSITFLELHNTILQKIGQQSNKQIMQVFYRVSMTIGKSVLRYRSQQLRSDDDIGLMFTFHSQFPDIRIIELFVVLKELHFSFGGFAPNPAHVPVQNENVQAENVDDLMGGPSFHQLAMQIAELLSQVSPISGYDFSVNGGDDEEEPVEVLFDSDNGSDGVAEPITQS